MRYSYSVEKTNSRNQLFKDFGEFPPKPLTINGSLGEFDIIRIRGIGEIYYDYKFQRQFFQAIAADSEALSDVAIEEYGASNISTMQAVMKDAGRVGLIVSKIVLPLAFIRMLIRRFISHVRNGPRRQILGKFVPVFKDVDHIVIKSGRHVDRSEVPTISHEHIHLLQFRSPEVHSRHAQVPAGFIKEDMASDRHLLYFMEKMEVEARLHEFILSFYREHGQLPLTLSGFFGLLAASEEFGGYIEKIFKLSGTVFEEYEKFSDRDVTPLAELESIWIYASTFKNGHRFITEVLPVMYGNLIKYYGDGVESERFLRQIKRPNLYDELYSQPVA